MESSYINQISEIIDKGGYCIISCPPFVLSDLLYSKFKATLEEIILNGIELGHFKYIYKINNRLYEYEGNWGLHNKYFFKQLS